MDERKRKKLETAGFRVGDAEDFLGLTEEEQKLVDLRLKISRIVRHMREAQELTQSEVARKLQSSQSRIAKLEAGAAEVSLDMMFRCLFLLGGKISDLIDPEIIPSKKRKRANRKVNVS